MAEPGKTPLLVVDDDEAIRHLLRHIAERAGFAVDAAKDGLEALELLGQKEYVIAIVDLMMPRLSGYELVQHISTLKPRPIVIVATALTNADVATLDDSMVRRVIRKPFDVTAVAEALIDTARRIADERSPADTDRPATLISDRQSQSGADSAISPPDDVAPSADDVPPATKRRDKSSENGE